MGILFGPLTAGRFCRRDNRFRATVEVEGRPAAAHLPNSGRLAELLIPGTPALLRAAGTTARKTDFDLVLLRHADIWVCIDARLPPLLLQDAWQRQAIPFFLDYPHVVREPALGAGRVDLRFTDADGRPCWVETKSVTLVENGVALFPDAPTARGRRHLSELAGLAADGVCSAVVFVVQREDARAFSPHDGRDPAFGQALRAAAEAGVSVQAYRCQVSPQEIAIAEPLPLLL